MVSPVYPSPSTRDDFSSSVRSGFSDVREYCAQGCEKIRVVIGAVLSGLQTLKNSPDNLSMAIDGIRYSFKAIKVAGGENYSKSAAGKLFNQADAVIDATRVFSDAHYFFSGKVQQEWEKGKFFEVFSRAIFSVKNGIQSFLGIADMAKISVDTGFVGVLNSASKGFVIAGCSIASIGVIRDLCEEEGYKDPSKWLDLAMYIAGGLAGALMLTGVATPPVLIALGLFSAACGLASVLYTHYVDLAERDWKAEKPEPSLDIAGRSDTLGRGLALAAQAIASLKLTSISQDALESAQSIGNHIKAFGALGSGLMLIQWMKEWILDVNVKELSSEKIAGKVFTTVGSSLDLLKFLNTLEVIDLGGALSAKLGRLPIFSTVKDVCTVGAAVSSLATTVPDANKKHQDLKEITSKKERWDFIARNFDLNSPCTESDNVIYQRLNWYYLTKYNKALAEHASSKNSDNKKAGSLDKEKVKYLEGKVQALQEHNFARLLKLKKMHLLEKMQEKQFQMTDQDAQKQYRKIKAIGEKSLLELLKHKQDVNDAKHFNAQLNLGKSALSVASDIAKIAVPVLTLIGAVFAVSTLLPFVIANTVLAVSAALIGFTKVLYDNSVEMKKIPELNLTPDENLKSDEDSDEKLDFVATFN